MESQYMNHRRESWCQRSHSIKFGGLECNLALLNQLTEIDFDEQDLFPMEHKNTPLLDTLETINWNPNQSDSSFETDNDADTDTDTDSSDFTQEQQSSSESEYQCEMYQSHDSSSSSNSSFSSQTTIPLPFPIFQPNHKDDETSFESSQQIMTKLQQFASVQKQHQKQSSPSSMSSPLLFPQATSLSKSPTKKRSRQKALKFPVKLMNALMKYSDETINGDSFKWLPDGRSFVVIDPDLFCERVLKQVFPKECKYSSFIRKLHRWNFVKVPCGYGKDCFRHPLFVKDEYQLVTKIVSQPRNDK